MQGAKSMILEPQQALEAPSLYQGNVQWIRCVPHRGPRLYECCLTTGQQSVSWRNVIDKWQSKMLDKKTEPIRFWFSKLINNTWKFVTWNNNSNLTATKYNFQKYTNI
jgi:hypothetical protein